MEYSKGGLARSHSSELAFLHRVLDTAIIVVALLFSAGVHAVEVDEKYALAAALSVVLFLFTAEATNLYTSWRVSRFREEVVKLLVVLLIVASGLVVIAFLAKTSANYSRLTVMTWGIVACLLLVAQRIGLRLLLRASRKRGHNIRTLAIAGAGPFAASVAERISMASWTGLQLIGFYDDKTPVGAHSWDGQSIQVKGDLHALVELARTGGVDYVYIALSIKEEERVRKLVHALSDTTASVCLVPDVFVSEIMQARWTNLDGMPVVSIFESPFYGADGWLKRMEDVVFATFILAIAAIPMMTIAAAVWLSSPGKVLFKQRRYGLNGKVVEVWKFRTMTVSEDGERVEQVHKNDERVTPLGTFLRRTSLDELPQFINVLMGSMSIVGPRPHAIAHNEQYRGLIPGYMLRHKVKPGITGLAQINGWRGETDTLEKMQKRIGFDLEYIRNWSLWLDVKIVVKTIFGGFSSTRAY